jgi:hypothetical protein
MASSERIRIEIGFDGGQVMSAQVLPEAADGLQEQLAAGSDGAFPLDADDGRYLVALRRIVYVKRFARESRLGFGNS